MNQQLEQLKSMMILEDVEGKKLPIVRVKTIEAKEKEVLLTLLDGEKTILAPYQRDIFKAVEKVEDFYVVALDFDVLELNAQDENQEITAKIKMNFGDSEVFDFSEVELNEFLVLSSYAHLHNAKKEEKEELLKELTNKKISILTEEGIGYFEIKEFQDYDNILIETNEGVLEANFSYFVYLLEKKDEYEEMKAEQYRENLHEETNVFNLNGKAMTNLEVRYGQLLQKEKDGLKKFGFYTHYVFDNEGSELVNCHTHGIKENFDHPDLQFVLPFDPNLYSNLFHGIVNDILKKGEKLQNNLDKVIKNFNIQIKEVKEDDRFVIRIILPDPNGKFPMDEGCQELYKKQMTVNEI